MPSKSELCISCGECCRKLRVYVEMTGAPSIDKEIDRFYDARGGKLIGYANLMTFAEEAHLTNIAVSPDYRRRGIGRVIMDHLIAKAEAEGCRAMFLDVRVSNHSAISFYEKYEFTELYRRKRYYRNPPEDAMVMVRPLGERNTRG